MTLRGMTVQIEVRMGGRGRETKYKDRWDWVKELSDQRLENYGRMSGDKMSARRDFSKEALNWACANEYERRTGVTPTWKK